MDEPDGIKGVLAVQCSQPKLLDAVVYHEVADQYQVSPFQHMMQLSV